jgi:hypothetical protein
MVFFYLLGYFTCQRVAVECTSIEKCNLVVRELLVLLLTEF